MNELRLTQSFNMPVSALYQAWTDSKQISEWFAPGKACVQSAECDAKVGGQYRFSIWGENGQLYVVSGTYRHVQANQRLVFTWQWQHSPSITEVEVLFAGKDESTSELTLVHRQFTDNDSCEEHIKGWKGCLLSLISHFERSAIS